MFQRYFAGLYVQLERWVWSTSVILLNKVRLRPAKTETPIPDRPFILCGGSVTFEKASAIAMAVA